LEPVTHAANILINGEPFVVAPCAPFSGDNSDHVWPPFIESHTSSQKNENPSDLRLR
jgi:hypothetical protein